VWHQVKITTAGLELIEQMCYLTALKTKAKKPNEAAELEISAGMPF